MLQFKKGKTILNIIHLAGFPKACDRRVEKSYSFLAHESPTKPAAIIGGTFKIL
ncbi:hypothetical protein [Nostoc sp. MS1]|uniref:hypothetical protein n=1 Tax=Nostoc sp. MS1 TaxID=2764711 RepID=UPI001CC39D4D|nr:hypothetical protein [Nostoc sp. MS1]BCL37984.1 hypothetical protein NSMS1_44310 [Nostoc sp. MS1]